MGAVALVLLAMVAGFIFSSKYAGKISRIFLDLNPFKPEQGPGDGGESGAPSSLNETVNESEVSTGGGGGASEAEEVTYGAGRLDILNSINYNYYGSQDMKILHRTGALEGYDIKDSAYYGMFNPSGIKAKIISNITGYELEIDSHPTNSLSTISLELSLHSQSGDAITLNSTNELRLSFPLANSGYNFSGKTLTLQQYNPSNTSESFPSYDVRDIIDDNGGGVVLARLDGKYNLEEPYSGV